MKTMKTLSVEIIVLAGMCTVGCGNVLDDISSEPHVNAPEFVQITEMSEQPASPQLGRLVRLRVEGGLGLQLYSDDARVTLSDGRELLIDDCIAVDAEGDELLAALELDNEAVLFANLYEQASVEDGVNRCSGSLAASTTKVVRVTPPNPPDDDASIASAQDAGQQ